MLLPLRLGGWANLAIAAAHLSVLGWAWTVFRWVDIEKPMRDLADQNAVLPYLLTLLVAAFFLVLGLEIRAGLHTGECELVGDKITGIAVNIGARIATRVRSCCVELPAAWNAFELGEVAFLEPEAVCISCRSPRPAISTTTPSVIAFETTGTVR